MYINTTLDEFYIKIKFIKDVKHTEHLFDNIEDFVANTCPYIDKVIKGIVSAQRNLKVKGNYDESQLNGTINDAASNLWNLKDDMENLRKLNESIRNWGASWKRLAKKLFYAIATKKHIDIYALLDCNDNEEMAIIKEFYSFEEDYQI